jgi:hypothetical protein
MNQSSDTHWRAGHNLLVHSVKPENTPSFRKFDAPSSISMTSFHLPNCYARVCD